MAFTKLKQRRSEGFTLVELLIVIVVIAILAAITIIAYNGVTQKARTSQSVSAANSVQQVAELFNTDEGNYPASVADFTKAGLTTKLPTSITLDTIGASKTASAVTASDFTLLTSDSSHSQDIGYAVTLNSGSTIATGGSNVSGGVVWHYDYTNNNVTTNVDYVGNATSSSTVYPLPATTP